MNSGHPSTLPRPPLQSGRYDAQERRRAVRQGRQKGCSIYIAAEELLKAGIDPDGPAPRYRVWGTARGGVFVRLYREPA